jgi:hypothetical protein
MNGPANSTVAARGPRHIPALDGLRALAILLVIPHNTFMFGAIYGWLIPFAWLANAGWVGVQLFFVLSGFLITRNLLDSRGSDNYYSAFFGRRILRIFPLYFLVLIFFLLLLPLLVHLSPNILGSYSNQAVAVAVPVQLGRALRPRGVLVPALLVAGGGRAVLFHLAGRHRPDTHKADGCRVYGTHGGGAGHPHGVAENRNPA